MTRRLSRQALRGLWLAKTQAEKRAAIDYLAEKLEESSRGERETETEREGGQQSRNGGGEGYNIGFKQVSIQSEQRHFPPSLPAPGCYSTKTV